METNETAVNAAALDGHCRYVEWRQEAHECAVEEFQEVRNCHRRAMQIEATAREVWEVVNGRYAEAVKLMRTKPQSFEGFERMEELATAMIVTASDCEALARETRLLAYQDTIRLLGREPDDCEAPEDAENRLAVLVRTSFFRKLTQAEEQEQAGLFQAKRVASRALIGDRFARAQVVSGQATRNLSWASQMNRAID